MKVNDPESKRSRNKEKDPYVLSILGVVAFMLLLIMMIYLANRLETIEDQLQFQPPSVTQERRMDSFGIDIVEGQTVYVPVYSHIYSGGGEAHLLEVTLSIRNTDPQRAINVASVQYFDTNGGLIKDYFDGSLRLGPLESSAILVEKQDIKGGSGANFIVVWNADEPVYEPIIEAVMVGLSKGRSISFSSPGRALSQRIE